MLEHRTEITLRAEPTHEGTNDIIAAVIDKLGELTHGCAIITDCKMTINWVASGTYQTHLEYADIRDTCIDPEDNKKKENLRMKVTEWIDNFIEFRGSGRVLNEELGMVLHEAWMEVCWVGNPEEYPSWIKDIKTDWTVDEFNWFCNGMNLKYRLLTAKLDDCNCYMFVDITKKEDPPSQ